MSKKKSTATRRAEQLAVSERNAAARQEQARAERRRRSLLVGAVVAVVLVLVLGIGYVVQSARDSTGATATPPAGATDHYALLHGEADAPVTVTVYEDFMCPFCGDFESASGTALDELVRTGDVRVEYRVVSFLDRASKGTDYSTRAMNALGVVLDRAGAPKAVALHDRLFADQPEENSDGLSDDDLVRLAVEAGADESAVRGPIEDLAFEPWVVDATEAANEAGIESTPTVQVDGETLDYTTIDELVTALQQAIAAARSS